MIVQRCAFRAHACTFVLVSPTFTSMNLPRRALGRTPYPRDGGWWGKKVDMWGKVGHSGECVTVMGT